MTSFADHRVRLLQPGWPCCTSPSASPDGHALAFVADFDGQPALWVADLDQHADPVRLTTGAEQVRAVSWSPDGRWLACLVAPFGGEHTRVLVLRPDGTGLRTLAAPTGGAAALGPWRPDGRLLGVAEVHAGSADWQALAVDPDSGRRVELAAGPAAVVSALHPDGRRALVRVGPRGARQLLLVDLATGRREPLLSAADATVADARFTDDGRRALLHTDGGRDRVALLELGLDDAGPARALAERADADVDLFATCGGCLAVVWNVDGYSEVELRVPGEPPAVLAPPAEVVTSVGFSAGGAALLLGAEGPGNPPFIARHSVLGGRGQRLIPARPVGEPVAAPRRLRFTAADGIELFGWWYGPLGPRRTGPMPTVVWLHGGPEAQERPGYAPLPEALVAADVAVFAPNVRGSSGRGRAFVNADNGAGRYAAIADVAAAVRFLTDTGLADPGRIGVAGRSYGGYLTLAALVHHPDLFAVGVDVCGMADLRTFFSYTEPWIARAAAGKYGDPNSDDALLNELSPLRLIDRLAAPLLVVHGEHDTNVPLVESEQVVQALRERGRSHRLLLFADEGHDIRVGRNRATFVREVVVWVTDHLLHVDERTA
jgi:dipeptidyl aminopeptidase/acylaminoacyl peptidase